MEAGASPAGLLAGTVDAGRVELATAATPGLEVLADEELDVLPGEAAVEWPWQALIRTAAQTAVRAVAVVFKVMVGPYERAVIPG
jgi:hypothetical protein